MNTDGVFSGPSLQPKRLARWVVFVLALVTMDVGLGCGPKHVAAFTPRNRIYKPGRYAAAEAQARPVDGSLYNEAFPGFLQDTRAVRAGDILVVTIDEATNAKGNATTKLSKDSSREAGVTAFLGLVPALKKEHPDIDPTQLLNLMAKSEFSGDGQTQRKGELKGSIAVHVREVMPNGDLFVEGTKVVMINNEENHLYISGVVRPSDIGRENTIASSRIADAQVEFTGRGDMADQIDRGWFAKILDSINPF